MTFDYLPDIYKAPTLNTRLLCREAYNTYKFLKELNALDKHNTKYLIPILKELEISLSKDKVAKETITKLVTLY